MNETPRTDAAYAASFGAGIYELFQEAKEMERELTKAKAELAKLKKVIRKVYYETETYADGAPDATDHDKLCNEIAYELKPFIHNKDI